MARIVTEKVEILSTLLPKESIKHKHVEFSIFDDCGVVNLSIIVDSSADSIPCSIYVCGEQEIKQILNFLQFALKQEKTND